MTQSRPVDVADTDVYITRAFNAPRELVFRFWTQAEQLASWFGPVGYSVPVDSAVIEPRVGGHWDFAMVNDTTGESFPVRGTIIDLVEPELLVIVLSAETEGGALQDVTLRVQFHDHGDRTRITLVQGPFTKENRDMTESGWESSFGKFDAILAAERE